MSIKHFLLSVAIIGITFQSCGQQYVFKNDKNGIADLRIQDVMSKRVTTVYHDPYGRTLIGNERRFSFTLNIINAGTADFVGWLSVSNTRSDLNRYDHTEHVSTDSIRIHVNEVITISTSDGFTDFVNWVRFRLDAKSFGRANTDSLIAEQTAVHFKEINISNK